MAPNSSHILLHPSLLPRKVECSDLPITHSREIRMAARSKRLMTAIARDMVTLVHSFPLNASVRAHHSGGGDMIPAVSSCDSAQFVDVFVDLYTPSDFEPNPLISLSDRGQWEDMEQIGQDFRRAIETVRIEHAA